MEVAAIQSAFAKMVEAKLQAFGRGVPKLVFDTYDERNFGDAAATFELAGLRLRFIRDRGVEMIDIEVPDDGDYSVCSLENLATALDWIAMNDLLEHYGICDDPAETSFEEGPPPGPFHTLNQALSLLEDHWQELARVCVDGSAKQLHDKIEKTIQQRLNTLLSAS